MNCLKTSTAARASPSLSPTSHIASPSSPSWRHAILPGHRSRTQTPTVASTRDIVARSSSTLTAKRCEPCESDAGSMGYMGLCGSLQRPQIEELLEEEQVNGWELREDEQKRLRLRRRLVAKNFAAALQLCERIGALAESEGHHPDLHITGWNKLTLELWTHARDGITENDFIVAAKINALPLDDLVKTKAKA